MDTPEADPRLPRRPLWGLTLLALPLVGVAFTVVAYAITWSFGISGRAATGDTVELRFEGCPEARPAIEGRLADMGLPVEAVGPWAFRATLPSDARAAERIPATLTRPGLLEAVGDGQVLVRSDDIVEASVRMDLMMTPRTLLRVDEDAAARVRDYVRAQPRGVLAFFVDGEQIGTQVNTNPVAVGEIEIDPPIGGRDRWDATAEWSITLDHPLPCVPRLDVVR